MIGALKEAFVVPALLNVVAREVDLLSERW